jgi:hypothetical protein
MRRLPQLVLLLLVLAVSLCTTIHAFPLPLSISRKTHVVPLSMIRKSKKGSSSSSSGGKPTTNTKTTSGGFGAGSSTSSSSSSVSKSPPSWAARFPFAGTVRPGARSSERKVVVSTNKIVSPDYAQDGRPKNARPMLPWVIEVKKPAEISKMRESGKLARQILDLAGRSVKPGVTTEEIDEIVHQATIDVSILLFIGFCSQIYFVCIYWILDCPHFISIFWVSICDSIRCNILIANNTHNNPYYLLRRAPTHLH